MASRTLNKLTVTQLRNLRVAGAYGDGGGLWLIVKPSLAKQWVFRFRWRGPEQMMGLGSYPTVSLPEARQAATDARAAVARGVNPIEARRAAREPIVLKAEPVIDAPTPTFGDLVEEVLAAQSGALKTARNWQLVLRTKVAALHPRRCDEIQPEDIEAVLRPMFEDTPVLGNKAVGYMRRVFDLAKRKGLLTGDNPAVWTGNLSLTMKRPPPLTSRGHHMALPYPEMPSLMAALSERNGLAARALEMLILTALRATEVIGAEWEEIDFEAKVWNVPAERMKMKRPHRVPLSGAAIEKLKQLAEIELPEETPFLFPSLMGTATGHIDRMSMTRVLARAGVKDRCTVHGFRSSFRDWVGEETEFQTEVAEFALSHRVGNDVERSYARGDMLEKRVPMMDAWAEFLLG